MRIGVQFRRCGTEIARRVACVGAALLLVVSQAPVQAGGPIDVGGPTLGVAGQPFTWDIAALKDHAVQYRVDGGPLSKTPSGAVVIDNATGVARVQRLFGVWQGVTTANIAYENAGALQAVGSFAGGDVQTAQQFVDVDSSCGQGVQSPIIFDADGSIFRGLGLPPEVIGFAGICAINPSTGHILTGEGVLNGAFQDGINSSADLELTAAEFDQAFVHEFGHFSGLDHSQINGDVLAGTPGACSLDEVAGLPLMFPILFCQARVAAGLPPLAPDDTAWISRLYPVTAPTSGKTLTSAAFGTISGSVLFSDGISAVQGVNVIARQVDNPGTAPNESLRNAVSVVSGYLFTGNLGQSVSCINPNAPPSAKICNTGGSALGSRDARLVGTFDLPLTPGNYTVEAESVNSQFVGGSSVGPLDPPLAAPGTAPKSASISVTAGATVTLNVVLQNTPPRFDSFESSLELAPEPALPENRHRWFAGMWASS